MLQPKFTVKTPEIQLVVTSGWKKTKKGCKFKITVPANTAAEIRLPDGRTETVHAGRYTYELSQHSTR